MKRILGTMVLFVLLVLTVFALMRLDSRDESAFSANVTTQHSSQRPV